MRNLKVHNNSLLMKWLLDMEKKMRASGEGSYLINMGNKASGSLVLFNYSHGLGLWYIKLMVCFCCKHKDQGW